MFRACLKKAFCKMGRADCGNDFQTRFSVSIVKNRGKSKEIICDMVT